MDYSCTCNTTLDNPVIRALVQNQVELIAKNRCLEEVINYLQTQLRKKPPSVAALPCKFGNPFRNNQAERKSISCSANDVLDIVAGACFDKSI